MLDSEALGNIETIKINARKVWGGEVVFGEIQDYKYPFAAFAWPIKLYGKYDLRIEYDRSILGIRFGVGEKEVGLFQETEKVLGQKLFHGFQSCVPENMLHNFKLLDELVKSGNLDEKP